MPTAPRGRSRCCAAIPVGDSAPSQRRPVSRGVVVMFAQAPIGEGRPKISKMSVRVAQTREPRQKQELSFAAAAEPAAHLASHISLQVHLFAAELSTRNRLGSLTQLGRLVSRVRIDRQSPCRGRTLAQEPGRTNLDLVPTSSLKSLSFHPSPSSKFVLALGTCQGPVSGS